MLWRAFSGDFLVYHSLLDLDRFSRPVAFEPEPFPRRCGVSFEDSSLEVDDQDFPEGPLESESSAISYSAVAVEARALSLNPQVTPCISVVFCQSAR